MHHYKNELFEELRLLSLFSLESNLNGLKIHHDADDELVKAAQRLFDKGLITQFDGGYLTDGGRELSEHVHQVLDALEA